MSMYVPVHIHSRTGLDQLDPPKAKRKMISPFLSQHPAEPESERQRRSKMVRRALGRAIKRTPSLPNITAMKADTK